MQETHKKIVLLCFHFAGGNKYSYPSLTEIPEVETVFFELPGRGDRYNEELLTDMEDVLVDLFLQIKPYLNRPFAFFGHSMGSLVSFLLAHLLKEQGLPLPIHLFLSGRVPPTLIDEADRLYLLPKNSFWQGINDFGGVPTELLKYPDLMQIYEPMIRADLQVLDSYDYDELEALNIPFSIFHGTKEKLNGESALKWQEFSSRELSIHEFEGDHFFILQKSREIIDVIQHKLQSH
jgi:surfactin synthase thioesterase subunit